MESDKKKIERPPRLSLTLIWLMYALDVGTVTLLPVIMQRLVPGFVSPTSAPVLGSTTHVKSVTEEPAPRLTALGSFVTFPFPMALAKVFWTYRL